MTKLGKWCIISLRDEMCCGQIVGHGYSHIYKGLIWIVNIYKRNSFTLSQPISLCKLKEFYFITSLKLYKLKLDDKIIPFMLCPTTPFLVGEEKVMKSLYKIRNDIKKLVKSSN